MAVSDRKEIAKPKQEELTLKPFYKIPGYLSSEVKVELDDLSKRLIEKGDSKELNLFSDEVKANFGQRYVVVIFIKDNTFHMRAIPGFEYVEDEMERNKLAAKAAAFFGCGVQCVAFPDHAVWTGVVHQQLIQLIKKNEPKLVAGSRIIACSMIKNNGKYSWLNRSALNESVFSPDALASACYVFEEKSSYSGYKVPAFDLYYHLKRSIPRDIFIKLITALTEKICEDDSTPLAHLSLDECTNFAYETKWEILRKQYQENKALAVEKIQHMLMKNLYVFLWNLSAADGRDRARAILIEGLSQSRELGLLIDVDFIPPEFAGKISALEKAEVGETELLDFLRVYKKQYVYRSLRQAAEEKNREKAAIALEKWKSKEENSIKEIFMFVIPDEELELIKLIYEVSQSKFDKDIIRNHVLDLFRKKIILGQYDLARKYLQLIPKHVILPSIIMDTETNTPIFPTMLYRFALALLEENPDFNSLSSKGYTFLHQALIQPNSVALVQGLLAKQADPNKVDGEGRTPLFCAAKMANWTIVLTLLDAKADPNLKPEGMNSPLRYALQARHHRSVLVLLSYGAQFTDCFTMPGEIYDTLDYYIQRQGYDFLNVYMRAIKEEDNPLIQANLLNVVYKFFDSQIVGGSKNQFLVTKLLQYTLVSADFVIEEEVKLRMERLYFFLERMDSKKSQLDLMSTLLNEESMIGRRLLLDKTHGEHFRNKINKMRLGVDLELKCEDFIFCAGNWQLEKAKESIQAYPSEMLRPYIHDNLMYYLADTLLEDKPDFNKKYKGGETLLHMIIKSQSLLSLFQSLLDHNADPNILDDEGNSVIFLAASHMCSFEMKCLLEKNADPNLNPGKSALAMALINNHYEGVMLLLEHGAKFPAGFASESSDGELTKHLLLIFNYFLQYGTQVNPFDVLNTAIKNETLKVQEKLMHIIFSLFYENLSACRIFALKILLKIVELPDIALTDFDQRKYIDKFNDILKQIPFFDMKLILINAVLDSKSSIGKRLLSTQSASSGMFPTMGETFRESLIQMKLDLEKYFKALEEKNRIANAKFAI